MPEPRIGNVGAAEKSNPPARRNWRKDALRPEECAVSFISIASLLSSSSGCCKHALKATHQSIKKSDHKHCTTVLEGKGNPGATYIIWDSTP